MFSQKALSDDLCAAIKEQTAAATKLEKTLAQVWQNQLLSERKVYRFTSSVPTIAGTITARPISANSVRIHTILINADITIGALTLQLGPITLIFQNPASGFIFLNDQDYKLSNADSIQLSAATYAVGKQLALAVFGEQVGDAGWVA